MALIVGMPLEMPKRDALALPTLEARLVPMKPVEPVIHSVTPSAKLVQPKAAKRRARPAKTPSIASEENRAPSTPVEAQPIADEPISPSAETPPITEAEQSLGD